MSLGGKLVYYILCAGLFIYLIVRSVHVPFVHDESMTFFHYIHTGQIWPGTGVEDANNHLLNSYLSHFFYRIFGESALVLRLPNVLSILVLFVYLRRISDEIKSKSLRWAFLLGILFAHYFFEFFGLCRGYGMSMAFIIAALSYLMRHIKTHRHMDAISCLIWMSLALLANMALMNSVLIMLTLLALSAYFSKPSRSDLKILLPWTAVFGLFLTLMIYHSMDMKNKGLLYYGQGDGIWDVAVLPICEYLFGDGQIGGVVSVIVILIAVGAHLVGQVKSRPTIQNLLLSEPFTVLLAGNLVGMVLLHYLLGVNYPEDRVGLYLFPFMIGALIFQIDRQRIVFLQRALALLCLFFPIDFFLSANTDHVHHWYREHIGPEMISAVEKEFNDVNHRPTFNAYHTQIGSHMMSQRLMDKPLGTLMWENHPDGISDFLMLRDDQAHLAPDGYDLRFTDEVNNNSLWKRKLLLDRSLIESQSDTSMRSHTEYGVLLDITMPLAPEQSLLIESDIDIEKAPMSKRLQLIIAIKDSAGENLLYSNVYLSRLQMTPAYSARVALPLSKIPEGATRLKVYLWSPDQDSFVIAAQETRLYRLSETN